MIYIQVCHIVCFMYTGHLNNFLLLYRGAGGAENKNTNIALYFNRGDPFAKTLKRGTRGVVCFFQIVSKGLVRTSKRRGTWYNSGS